MAVLARLRPTREPAPQIRCAGISRRQAAILRLLDLAVAVVVLVALAPLMALIAIVIRLTSPGPAIFRQVRVGYRQRQFGMLKFRTMRLDANEELHRQFVVRMLSGQDPRVRPGSGLYKLQGDPRVTRVGAVLRRLSLDELPQFVNVLRGEMSVVGPRPMLPWEVGYCPDRCLKRFDVKPGITGLWQVSGRNRLTMQQALELDLQYVSQQSVALYAAILLRTIPAALSGQEAR